MKIKRALVSVSDKSYLDILAKWLLKENVEVISSGGTAKALEEFGLKPIPVEKITGNPEAFGGRMKTLSFQVSSGLLYRRGHEEDEKEALKLGIKPIDLVVCNLYPFSQTAKETRELDTLVEKIDIGGPTMIRAAAKNFKGVSVLTHSEDYEGFIASYEKSGEVSLDQRKKFALKAFSHTASYDSIIAEVLTESFEENLDVIHMSSDHGRELRYGENPHQRAQVISHWKENGLASVNPLQGKELSYNNFLDSDAAWRAMSDIHRLKDEKFPFSVSVVKHSNSCGLARGADIFKTLEMAWNGDPISSFGSIIAFNSEVTKECAEFLTARFVEVIIAPSYDKAALDLFSTKKNLRLIKLDPLEEDYQALMVRSIYGGWLIQEEDNGLDPELLMVTKKSFSQMSESLISFGTFSSKHLRSNAIAIVGESDEGQFLMGGGMGNPNRLISFHQAIDKARENGFTNFDQALLVSDAFFPFKDNIELAHQYGVKNIIQPGGSIKDKEVIAACDEFNIAMGMTKRRHFRH